MSTQNVNLKNCQKTEFFDNTSKNTSNNYNNNSISKSNSASIGISQRINLIIDGIKEYVFRLFENLKYACKKIKNKFSTNKDKKNKHEQSIKKVASKTLNKTLNKTSVKSSSNSSKSPKFPKLFPKSPNRPTPPTPTMPPTPSTSPNSSIQNTSSIQTSSSTPNHAPLVPKENINLFQLSAINYELLLNQIKSKNLPKLSDSEREATLGKSNLYLDWFKENAKDYHANGDKWSDDKHQMFFEEGLLNYYSQFFLQKDFLDNNYNYASWLTEYYANSRFSKDDRTQFLRMAKAFNLKLPINNEPSGTLGIKFHATQLENETLIKIVQNCARKLLNFKLRSRLPLRLRQLGGLFQRTKVEHEIILNKWADCEDEEAKKELSKKMFQKDAEAELLQTLIFHWTLSCIDQFKKFIKTTGTGLEDENAVKEFSFKDPDFLPEMLKI